MLFRSNLSFEAVLYGRIRAVGNRKICYSIDRMLCGNAARMPLSSYDDAAFYEEYIFALRNCPDMAKEAVENLSYLIGFLLGGLISMGLIASIQPVMLIFIGISILVSFGLSSLRQKLDLRYRERLAGVQVREQYVHRVFYMKDYAKELRSLTGLRDFLLGKFQEVERENMELAGEEGRKSFLLGILDILNKQTLMYWLIMLLTIVSIWRTGDIAPGSLLIMTTSVATAALLIGAIVGYLPALKKTRAYYEKLETVSEDCVEDILAGKYFAGVDTGEDDRRPFRVFGYAREGENYGGGLDGMSDENICCCARVTVFNITNRWVKPHFWAGHDMANDAALQLAIRAVEGPGVEELSETGKEHAARAIECGYLYREGDRLYTKILVCAAGDEDRLFDVTRGLAWGYLEEYAQNVAEKVAGCIRKFVPEHLLGEWKYTNWLAAEPVLDAILDNLVTAKVLIPPENGVGAEGCWMNVKK